MKIALEWFLNPDHLPLIVAKQKGIFKKNNLPEVEIIVPTEHYDGLQDLLEGNIEFATNEPLHLIEQFDPKLLSLGTFFETKGGVIMKKESYQKLKSGGNIKVATPVSNDKTNKIGLEIIKTFAEKNGFTVQNEQVEFCAKDFYLIKHMQDGLDAGWLYFYNFEGVEAEHENLDVVHMNNITAGFANFCALDIFTNKDFHNSNPEQVEAFTKSIQQAIQFINTHPYEAFEIYYAYAKEASSPLMNDILKETAKCFKPNFTSSFQEKLPILHFFNKIGVTDLPENDFKKAFLN